MHRAEIQIAGRTEGEVIAEEIVTTMIAGRETGTMTAMTAVVMIADPVGALQVHRRRSGHVTGLTTEQLQLLLQRQRQSRSQ